MDPERSNRFAERNLVLQLALGGLSAGEKLDRWLDAHVGPPPSQPPPDAPPPDSIVLALLGVIRLRKRLEAHLEQLAVFEEPPQPPPPQPPPSESLLR